MTDTDTQPKAKAPPAWMKREPLRLHEITRQLEAIAAERMAQATQATDNDVRQGLRDSANAMRMAVDCLNGFGEPTPALIDTLTSYGEARAACAIGTTGDTSARNDYMDDAHAFREAVRILKGAPRA